MFFYEEYDGDDDYVNDDDDRIKIRFSIAKITENDTRQ
jgi:hypothetical protein